MQAWAGPTRADLRGQWIRLFHGTSREAARKILADGRIRPSRQRTYAAPGVYASARIEDAAQYPEETGADAIVVIQALVEELKPDLTDESPASVEQSLFDCFGSSAVVGEHKVEGVIWLDAGEPHSQTE